MSKIILTSDIFNKSKTNQEGIGLMEVILAFGVSVIVISAMVSLATFVLRTSTESGRMMQGTRLANQELENLRVVRDGMVNDESWSAFYDRVRDCEIRVGEDVQACASSAPSACRAIVSPSQVRDFNSSLDTIDDISICFGTREVIEGGEIDPYRIDVISVATWTIGGERKYVHNYSRLTSWRHK